MNVGQRTIAEFFGTFWLVFGGCGSAVFAAAFPDVGIGLHGVSIAFGLTVLTMAYAIGHISGCHLNPAVTIGLILGGRHRAADMIPYIIAQVLGAIAAALALYLLLSGKADFDLAASGLASNGYGEHSPGQYSMTAGFIAEVLLTFFFLLVIMGATHPNAPSGLAPVAIGLCLALIHLIAIPITNVSVNPARSTGPALVSSFVGNGEGWAMGQLWLFWVAPIIGGGLGGLVYRALCSHDED
ncbi:MAG: aquaporin Z [Pseudomonadota bacterium]